MNDKLEMQDLARNLLSWKQKNLVGSRENCTLKDSRI